jgi:hypothetical protein
MNLVDIDDIKPVIRAVIVEVLAEMIGKELPHDKFMTITEAYPILGYSSRDALWRRIRDGTFRYGHEVIRDGKGDRAPRKINIVKARKRLQELSK